MNDEETINYIAPELSPRELVDTFFPEALPAIKRNLRDLKHDLKLVKEIGSKMLDIIFDERIVAGISDQVWQKFLRPINIKWWHDLPVQKIERNIKFLESLINISNIKEVATNTGVRDAYYNIERAKTTSIETVIEVKNNLAVCPFHNDRHASLHIYKEQNRFHCFSCGADGDVIDLVQKMYGLDFKSAVYKLNK